MMEQEQYVSGESGRRSAKPRAMHQGTVLGRSRFTQETVAKQDTSPSALTGMRVLVADASAVNQQVAMRQLRKLGVHADVVCNGQEALDAVSSVRYDLVLMDCQMPVMDGFEATSRIRETGADMTIIAMTANERSDDRERCLAAGMNDYLAKPVATAALRSTLSRWYGAVPTPLDFRARPAALPAPDRVLDFTVLSELQGLRNDDGEPLICDLIDLFMQEVPIRVSELKFAVTNRDAVALKRAAHALKGQAAVIGAIALSRISSDVEQLALASGSTANAAASIVAIEAEIERTSVALEQERRRQSLPSRRALMSAAS